MNISKPLFTTALCFVILSAVFSSCKRNERSSTKPGMVVSAHPQASAVGVEVLKKGGNAVDAACAVELALAVSYPVAGNIGGGGFMVIRLNNGENYALDYREKAPLASTKDMYLNENGEVVVGLSTDSHLAVGVPGTVDGIIKAHARFGKLNFKDIIQPAINLAENGFPITQKQAERLNSSKEILTKTNSEAIAFVKQAEWKQGDTLKQPELAKTLKLIMDFGRDGFYSGITADRIVEQMKKHDGIITLSDLASYSSVWREPITGQYHGVKVISMPPPSSGGIALLQLLNMVEPYPVNEWGWHDMKTIHLMVEAERRVYADRAEFLGDPDFYNVPAEELLNKEYLKQRMADFNPVKATPSKDIKHGNPTAKESEETTHYSIVDKLGNAVAVTTTLNRGYGSKIVVDGAGFLLNNEMDDFSSKPGFPNSYGLVGGDANAIQPGKRMLSSMTPTILEKDGNLFMVLGSPGGSTIITSVFQTVMNVVDFDMDMQQAVTASRFHSQWLPDLLYYEKGCFTDSMKNQLEQMGHILKERGSIGRVDAILCKPDGSLEGGADPRGDDIVMSTAQQ